MPCDAGMFSKEKASTTCTKCNAGSFSQNTGQSSCQLCPLGSYQNRAGMLHLFTSWYVTHTLFNEQTVSNLPSSSPPTLLPSSFFLYFQFNCYTFSELQYKYAPILFNRTTEMQQVLVRGIPKCEWSNFL